MTCGLVLVEVYALEVYCDKAFAGLFEELSDRNLAVLYIFLLHKAAFLEEFVETSVCNVLNHRFGKISGLGFSCFFHDLASLGCVVLCNPALGDVGLDVVLGVEVVGVEACLLEGCFNGFLDLLLLGLFYSDCDFLVDSGLGNVFAAASHGVHGCNLHADFASDLGVDVGEIEAYDSSEFVVEVVVGCG